MFNLIRTKKIGLYAAIIFLVNFAHAAPPKNPPRYECGTADLLYVLANLIGEKNGIDRSIAFHFDAIKTIQMLNKNQNVLKCEAKLQLVDQQKSVTTDSLKILYQFTIDEKSGGYAVQFEPSRN